MKKENKYQQALRVVQEGLSVDQYNEYLYSLAAEITSHLSDQKLMKKYLVKAHELAPENMTITLQYIVISCFTNTMMRQILSS